MGPDRPRPGLAWTCAPGSPLRSSYAAAAYVARLERQAIAISTAAVGQPRENGYAERLVRTIKEEEVDLSQYQGFADAG